MKVSENLYYDVVDKTGYAVQFKILGHKSALSYLDMYQRSFADRPAAPYRLILTRPQPRRTPEKAE